LKRKNIAMLNTEGLRRRKSNVKKRRSILEE